MGGGQGAAEEVALSFCTVLGLKECELFPRFDALGNHASLEALANVNYGAEECSVIWIDRDLVDKGLVYFQGFNGKLPEIAEARVAGAEVIHGEVYSHNFEPLKYGGAGFGMLHKDAFGELELEIARFQASFPEYCANTFEKILAAELDGRNIDSNRNGRQTRVLPGASLPACFA